MDDSPSGVSDRVQSSLQRWAVICHAVSHRTIVLKVEGAGEMVGSGARRRYAVIARQSTFCFHTGPKRTGQNKRSHRDEERFKPHVVFFSSEDLAGAAMCSQVRGVRETQRDLMGTLWHDSSTLYNLSAPKKFCLCA